MYSLLWVRSIAALMCVITVAWDYCRSEDTLYSFSTWMLLIQFIYFQLPLKSDAVAFFHPCAFVGSCAVPMAYFYLLWCNPSFEWNHVDLWDVSFETIVVRSILVHFAPLLFHALDITINQAHIIAAYQKKPKSFMCLWALSSFALFGLLFEVFMVITNSTFGGVIDDEELDSAAGSEGDYGSSVGMERISTSNVVGSTTIGSLDRNTISTSSESAHGSMNLATFLYHSRMFSLLGSIFALVILYSMVLKRAYFRSHHKIQ